MPGSNADIESRLLRLKQGTFPATIVRLAGDASTRSYFRACYPGGETRVLMFQAHPGQNEEASFLDVQRFLEDLGLPVPRVYAHHPGEGLIVLEDLGDELLETVVESANEDRVRALYFQAVDLLVRMRHAVDSGTSTCGAFDLAFDEAKLMQEMDFFLTHFVRGLAAIDPTEEASESLQEFFTMICGRLAAEPRIFTHRDYHARNLLVHEDRLVMIDFQDARMGPAQYDLASLLRDSYVTLPEDFIEELIDGYVKGVGEEASGSRELFNYVFDLMSLQRNIKALGTFGYQSHAKRSTRYISSIPRTARYIDRNIKRYPEFARFRSVVADLITGPALSFAGHYSPAENAGNAEA
ncbi:MAG: phosphotransferase [Desulfomonile tiedjei]|nr:phosphotransferase [Desulfomonile tiedjei]